MLDDVRNINYGFVNEDNVLLYVFSVKENDFTTIDRLKQEFMCSKAYPMNFEKEVAEIGRTIWNGQRFTPPSPHASWVFDDNLNEWIAPVPVPDSGDWKWNEETVSWEEMDLQDLSDPDEV